MFSSSGLVWGLVPWSPGSSVVACRPNNAARTGDQLLTSSNGRSDRGTVRSHNEDAFLDDPTNRLWAVADGMGGHAAGDVASKAVVRHLTAVVRPPLTADYLDRIDDALAAANSELLDYAREHKLQLVGSTAAVLIDAGHYMLCGWAGDSRVYQHAGGGLRMLTVDHNQAREMRAAGTFTDTQIESSPQSAALVRAVGAEKELIVEWTLADVAPHDLFLLCSDGVTKEMTDAEIAGALARPGPVEDIAATLVQTCLERGARDNITVVVVRIDG